MGGRRNICGITWVLDSRTKLIRERPLPVEFADRNGSRAADRRRVRFGQFIPFA